MRWFPLIGTWERRRKETKLFFFGLAEREILVAWRRPPTQQEQWQTFCSFVCLRLIPRRNETMDTRKLKKIITSSTVAIIATTMFGVAAPANAVEFVPQKTVSQETNKKINKNSYTQKNSGNKNSKDECKTRLIRTLEETGFKGQNLRQAWAIVMRESGGREDAISRTNDYGIFQLNKRAHGKQDWWDDKKLLTREYNAKIAFRMSQGGNNWSAWDISGDGRYLGNYSPRSVYNKYLEWYNKYPC
jgi:hypothetical protein